MRSWKALIARTCTAVGLALVAANTAGAQAVISNGTIKMGIDRLGQLNIPGGVASVQGTTTVGLRFITGGLEFESTADGCLCEGWGVGISGGTGAGQTGYANNAAGTSGLTSVTFASTASTATSVTRVGSFLEIRHEYVPAPGTPYLYQVNVTITNISGSTLGVGTDGIRYRRLMDWDIQPTAFSEVVTLQGWPATALLRSSNDGFRSADPFSSIGGVPCTGAVANGNFTGSGPCDAGALFDFGFPALAAGASQTFQTFYGGAPDAATMLAALGTVGAEVYTTAWCGGTSSVSGAPCNGRSGPAVFAYGFRGVGGTALPPPDVVPEPSTYAMLASGLVGVGLVVRRRRAA